MSIKLKALLLTLVYVAIPFLFVYTLIMHPLIILFAAIALVVYLVYIKVLDNLNKEHHRKNGYTFKEFNKELNKEKCNEDTT